MPRCLVMDWDQDRCQVLEGNVTRTGVKIERGAAWAQEEIFGLAQGEEAGKKFKDFLKGAGLTPAPLLVCLPKQRILLKELRCPAVGEDEEPALVRFQAAKELLENPDDVVLDYARMSRSSTESLILAAAVRKDLLAGYQALARVAGVKLLAVTPRPFVAADLLARCRKIDPVPTGTPPEWSAVLLLGRAWAELTILHGATVSYARSLANDDTIDSEVRRSLAMFATQPQGQMPQILYLFGPGASVAVQERLAQQMRMPVTRPAVLAGDDDRGGDSPAGVGLLAAWCNEKTAINFVKPKEPRPPAQGNQRTWMLAGGGALVFLLLIVFAGQQVLAGRRNEIAQAREEKETIERRLKGFEQDRVDMEAFEDWEQASFSLIDELGDCSARFPYNPPGFHLNKVDFDLSPRVSGSKEKQKIQARVVLQGVQGDDVRQLQRYEAMLKDDHTQVTAGPSSGKQFTILLDLMHQKADRYQELVFPAR